MRLVWVHLCALLGVLALASPSLAECLFAKGGRKAEIQTRSGQRVELFDSHVAIDGRLESRCEGLPGSHPLALAPFGDGFVVAFRDEPLHVWSAGRYAPLANAPEAQVRALASDGSTLWIGTTRGLLKLDPGGRARRLEAAPLGSLGITALHSLPNGALLVGTETQGMWTLRGAGARAERTRPKAIVGCFRARGETAEPLPPGPACRDGVTAGTLPSGHVTALVSLGAELAVATFDRGVFLLGPKDEITNVEGAPRHVNALARAGDRLYAGAANGLHAIERGRAERISLAEREPHVNDLVFARDGALWLATNRGLMRSSRGALRVFDSAEGLPSSLVYAVTQSADGAIWAGTARGLARLFEGAIRTSGTETGGLPHDWVTALFPDGNAVYAGTYNAGVVRVDAAGDSSPIHAFATVWVNPHGISRVRGSLVVASAGDGLVVAGPPRPERLPSSDVTAAVEHAGMLWIGTRSGLMRVAAGP